jgi:hypothetical protein
MGTIPAAQATSIWNPTLLVNTESFNTIDEGDGTTDVELRFGSTGNQKLIYDISETRFDFSHSLYIHGDVTATGSLSVAGAMSGASIHAEGTISASGALNTTGPITTDANLTINEDAGAADAVLTFGNASGNQTLTFSNAAQQFQFSDTVSVSGAIVVGNYAPGTGTGAGTIRWTGTDMQAYDGNGWTSLSKGGAFVGLTSGSTTGSFSTGSLVGYQAANELCTEAFAGSHMCRAAEIVSTIDQNISAFAGAAFGWAAQGPPGYTANANDCSGWTSESSSYLGAWWEYSTDLGVTIAAGGGKGFLVNCSVPQPISCCR